MYCRTHHWWYGKQIHPRKSREMAIRTHTPKKGPYVDPKVTVKVAAAKAASSRGPIKTRSRNSTIQPEFVGITFLVHNGSAFKKVLVAEEMVGHRFGEFAPNRATSSVGGIGRGRVVVRKTVEVGAKRGESFRSTPEGGQRTKVVKFLDASARNYLVGSLITARFRGGYRKPYQVVDFKRNTKDGIAAKVLSIDVDPNRSARIAKIQYTDGVKANILAPDGLQVGDEVISGPDSEVRIGNCVTIGRIPPGTVVHNVELQPGRGAQICRSAGCSATVTSHDGSWALLTLPSGEVRRVPIACRACIGAISIINRSAARTKTVGRGVKPKKVATRSSPIKKVKTPKVHEVRAILGLSQEELARVIGYSVRAIAEWEAGKKLGVASRQKLIETERLGVALSELIPAKELAEWLRSPNPAFEGQTPIHVIERGEADRIWQMIGQIDAGVAN